MSDYDARLGLYINGEWLSGGGRDTQPVLNPATGQAMADLPLATDADLDAALAAAERGFKLWRAMSPEKRGAILNKTAALIRERATRLAELATADEGKISAEAKGEVLAAAAMLEFQAAEGLRIYGKVLMRPSGTRSLVLKQPVGPVAAFCAWNFPVLNVVRKLSPALASGCSVILKPSEETPGAAVEVMRCFQDAGLPGEVAQMVFGVPDQVSRRLLASPVTRKLSFTGSVPVGKHLAALAAETVMKTTLELGGHAPVIVFDDCDVEKTLDTLVAHKFRNAGQVCIGPTRFQVQAGIYERFAEGFAARTRAMKMGAGTEAGVQMGPMANPRRPEAMEAFVQDARDRGAKVAAGGGRSAQGGGFYFEPTVLTDVPLAAKAMNEEPFGPIAVLNPFETFEQAVEEANRLPFGLAAYAFTENARRQNRLGDEVEAGMVSVNGVRLTWPDSPFGGMKDSGFGSEDGPEGLDSHMIVKTLHVQA
jgi:succinate-semialdehyde dehydrogenase/glutarate-semialdehyde dehydrogenase